MVGLELLHLSYVQRWVVAPTYCQQSVAEHTFRVMVIAEVLVNAVNLSPNPQTRLGLLRDIMAHDAEERLTGDIPGPVKSSEEGYLKPIDDLTISECLIKVADSIETATFWLQWGNKGAWSGHPYNRCPARDIEKIKHYAHKVQGLEFAAKQVWCEVLGMNPPYTEDGYPW